MFVFGCWSAQLQLIYKPTVQQTFGHGQFDFSQSFDPVSDLQADAVSSRSKHLPDSEAPQT